MQPLLGPELDCIRSGAQKHGLMDTVGDEAMQLRVLLGLREAIAFFDDDVLQTKPQQRQGAQFSTNFLGMHQNHHTGARLHRLWWQHVTKTQLGRPLTALATSPPWTRRYRPFGGTWLGAGLGAWLGAGSRCHGEE